MVEGRKRGVESIIQQVQEQISLPVISLQPTDNKGLKKQINIISGGHDRASP
jgi:hypothetical protein